ncbi:hypothetical protein O0L34_g7329 [Tuta absoluta]|nr:hypothetical protein O0L34_g7329 [Tuta absoluta]
MSIKVKILILFWAAGLVVTNPIDSIEQRFDVPESPEVTEFRGNQITDKKEDCSKQDDSSDCSNYSEDNKAVNKLQALQQEQQAATDYWQDVSSLPNYHQAYEGYPSLEALGGDGSYIDMMYPYLYPRLRATYNPGFNVNSLPPVHSTYIHGLVPAEEIQQSIYEENMLRPRRTLYYQPQRFVRMLRTPEDDFMAQLRHDAIMNNIVPTMQVPFARFASLAPPPPPPPAPLPVSAPVIAPVPYAPVPYAPGPYGPAGVTALYPSAGSGCAQPILFSCTPKITKGYLKPSYAPPVPSPGYREVSKASKNAMEHHAAPTKVDLGDKSAESKHEE